MKQEDGDQKLLINSWLFQNCSAEIKAEQARQQLKNKKITLRELWKNKFELDNSRIQSSHKNEM